MGAAIGVTVAVLAVCFLVFLVCRELVCWYFKINERLRLMQDQNKLLLELAQYRRMDRGLDPISGQPAIRK